MTNISHIQRKNQAWFRCADWPTIPGQQLVQLQPAFDGRKMNTAASSIQKHKSTHVFLLDDGELARGGGRWRPVQRAHRSSVVDVGSRYLSKDRVWRLPACLLRPQTDARGVAAVVDADRARTRKLRHRGSEWRTLASWQSTCRRSSLGALSDGRDTMHMQPVGCLFRFCEDEFMQSHRSFSSTLLTIPPHRSPQ